MWILDTAICDAQNNEIVPQVEHMGSGYDWDAPDSITQIRSNAPLDFRPDTRAFHLDPATNLTDVVSQGYIYTAGLLVSEAFYNTIRRFQLQAHEPYPAAVVHDGRTHAFRWVHFTEEVEDKIDFTHSEFAVRGPVEPEMSQVFANQEQLREKCRELVNTIGPVHLEAIRIVFPPGVPRYDLFSVLLTERRFFVSDALADELRRQRFTGFELELSEATVLFEE
jgi:hypothetical protein